MIAIFATLATSCAADRGSSTAATPNASANTPTARAATSDAGAAETFRFRVGVWANLHQALIHEALLPRTGFDGPKSLAHRSVVPAGAIAPSELAPWRDALSLYDRDFTTRNTFTDEHMNLVRATGAAGSNATLPDGGDASPPESAALPARFRSALLAAEPVYRAHFWPEHERADAAYVAAIRPLVTKHAAFFVARLSALYKTPWPHEPVDVDVTPVAPPFGASTIGEPPFDGPHRPLIVVSSLDPGYSGDSGLEMIFHEGSHLLIDRVQGMLDASAKRQNKSAPRALWHSVLFYTAGHVAKERLGPDYVPYAERPENHIFDGDGASILTILKREWQPYLDGKIELDAAVDALVAAF
jgi:hypothetical protein